MNQTDPPDSCAIAFKEWAGVCDALGSGRQSLILRKGGVSEGPDGFRPDHRAFWLYPTFVHEAEQGLRSPRASGMGDVSRNSGDATRPPHPNPPPQGGRGSEKTEIRLRPTPSLLVGEGRGGGSETWPTQGSSVTSGLVETPGEVAIEALAVVEWLARVETVESLARLVEYHDWTEASLLGRFHYRTPGLWALVVRVYRRAEPRPVAITPAQLGCKTWVPLESPPPISALVAVIDDDEAARRLASIRSALTSEVPRS